MFKSLLTTALTLLILLGVCVYEQNYINETFTSFSSYIEQTYRKIEEKSATAEDAIALQKFWIQKKRSLHIWIPHNEIKEVDLWISECVIYLREKNYEEALSKIEVVSELAEQIPNTFILRFENIF